MPVIVLVVVACFIVYLSWSFVLPRIQAPDEFMRILVPQFIAGHGALPSGWEESLRHPQVGTSYAFTVYGSSLVAVPFICIAQAFGAGEQGLIIAARFASVLFGTGTVALCFPIGARLLKRPATVVLFVLLVGFLPQFAFLSSYFNSETIEVFATALVILALLKGAECRWRLRDCLLLGIALGICALSYYFAYGAIVVSVVAYYATASTGGFANLRSGREKLLAYVGKPLLILLCALLVAGWFFVRNFVLYDGDLFGMATNNLSSELYGTDQWKPSMRPTLKNQGLGPLSVLTADTDWGRFGWITVSARSFVGVFGYLSIFLGDFAYALYFVILILGSIVGFAAWLRNRERRMLCLCLAALVGIPILLSWYFSWASDFQPQGRYFIAGLIPLMLFVAKGWETLAAAIGRKAKKAETVLTVGVTVVWMALFVYAVVMVIMPKSIGGVYAI